MKEKGEKKGATNVGNMGHSGVHDCGEILMGRNVVNAWQKTKLVLKIQNRPVEEQTCGDIKSYCFFSILTGKFTGTLSNETN